MIIEVVGGIGIFLLGMMLLTDGLRTAAADALRSILRRFTSNRFNAAASGAAITALVQSSSATTVATIGFVSAGLLTLPAAIAVTIGANVGTTSTGWLVSLLGFKVQVSLVALPMITAGALMRLFGRGRTAQLGLAAAGFGLIFVGIDMLQSGMAGVAEEFDLTGFVGDSTLDRLILVAVGVAMTVVMQSSSAALATTLAALYSEAIGLPAAVALAIGQNVGTTVTAVIAGAAATVPARRTAAAHVVIKTVTGIIAFFLLPLVPRAAEATGLADDPTIALASFHTAFNLLGLVLFLPVITPFAAFVSRLVPERHPSLTRYLDDSVASIPTLGVEAARRTTLNAAAITIGTSRELLSTATAAEAGEVEDARLAFIETRRFLSQVHSSTEDGQIYHRHLSVLHASDHGLRMAQAAMESNHRATLLRDTEVREAAATLAEALAPAQTWCAQAGSEGDVPDVPSPRLDLERVSNHLAMQRRNYRAAILERTARGETTPEEAARRLEAMVWVDRLGYHAWRAIHHLSLDIEPDHQPEERSET